MRPPGCGAFGGGYWARSARAAVRIARRIGAPLGPLRALFVVLALTLVPLGARMGGLEASAVVIVQLTLIVALLAAVFLLLDIELSGIGPGANDNASGVATVVSLARVLDEEPPDALDVWVVLTGGEEPTQEGMRAFVRAHRKQLDRATTYFVNVDAVGRGTLRYETRAGWIVGYGMGGRLAELCEAIASADAGPGAASDNGESASARPLRRATAGDSLPPRLAGYQAITITCRDELDLVPELRTFADTPEALDHGALERAHAFILELVRRLDRDVSPRSPP